MAMVLNVCLQNTNESAWWSKHDHDREWLARECITSRHYMIMTYENVYIYSLIVCKWESKHQENEFVFFRVELQLC